MNTTLPRSSIVAVWRRHPLAMTVAAGVGLAVGVLLTFSALRVQTAAAGDEPPIRVKNGSLDLDLPKGSGAWEKDPDAKHWKIAGNKEKKSTDFTVALFPDPGKTNCTFTTATGSSVVITYSDSTTVTLEIKNKKTKVTATGDLSTSQNDELLRYPGPANGYIKDITVGSSSMCTFSSASELSVALIWY
jgi:hypothetical protein